MKRIAALLLTLMPLMAFAQSYDQLWKSVKDAQEKDLPKTEISTLGKIISKATKEKMYGHLLAATLQRASTQAVISPDSAKVEIERLESMATKEPSPEVKAIYYAVLSDIYSNNTELDNHKTKRQEYAGKAMANPDALAKANASGYEPIVGKGSDSKIFSDDLLHVIGFLTGDYALLNKYYDAHGNRPAACISALKDLTDGKNIQLSSNGNDIIAKLDSIMNVYKDIPECGEVASERYNLMPQSNNTEAKAKYEYGEDILSRWPSWTSMSKVRNGQKSLIQPMLTLNGGSDFSIPNKERTAYFTARNLSEITVKMTRLNINGDTKLNPRNSTDIRKLLAAKTNDERSFSKKINIQGPYNTINDSITIPGLPVGMWLIEFDCKQASANTSKPSAVYELYHVSNLAIISESLPNNNCRIVVVNATTGKPVSGAHLRISQYRGYNRGDIVNELTADSKGEATFLPSNDNGINIWAYTDDDKASLTSNQWKEYYYTQNPTEESLNVFTDRSIYRPGQTVYVSLINYSQNNKAHTRKALQDKQITVVISDANGKEVSSAKVTTDKFGSASTSFALPASGLTGNFTIRASSSVSAWANIKVEEYKRPTFDVSFNDYNKAYSAGDTITVSGNAKTYAGVPVQNAKVEYTVKRQSAWWWHWFDDDDNDESFSFTGSATTDENGNFNVRVPIILPSSDINALRSGAKVYHYYNMYVSAKVTELGGESHEGFTTLPLGTNPTSLTCDLPDNILRDSLKTVTFKRTNMAGKEIDGTVNWKIENITGTKPAMDRQPVLRQSSPANKPIALKGLLSGKYLLTSVCGGDTIKKEFVVFSVSDKHPVALTHDWFWQSAPQFPSDGKPVYVQFGSSDNDQHFVYTLMNGANKVLEQGSLDQSDAIITHEFKYKEEYGDGLVLNVAWVRDGMTYTHRAEIRRPERDNKLRLTWKTFRNQLVPGQKEEWTLTVLTPDGKPSNAQLMATLYDKSLDQIAKHDWRFQPAYYYTLPGATWKEASFGNLSATAMGSIKFDKVNLLDLRSINRDYYSDLMSTDTRLPLRIRGTRIMYKAQANNVMLAKDEVAREDLSEAMAFSSTGQAPSGSAAGMQRNSDNISESSEPSATYRENLNELAFFYPQLSTDKDGNILIKFTLPESTTTWRFMGLAHDADINYGLLTDDAVAKKTVMVQPNMPRFIRQGDKAQITARIFNTSDKAVHGTARLELLNPATEKVLATEETTFNADSNSTAIATFNVNPSDMAIDGNDQTLLIARITAEGNGFSDGEQHYLPILPDCEQVTNTYPFTQVEKGTKAIDTRTVIPEGVKNAKVKFEYTNNPSWLMIQALPYVSNPNNKDAISLSTAYFANSIALNIMKSSPKIKNVFEQWKRETGSETSLMSNLEKDQELKSLVLNETPWVMDAEKESTQKRALANYFDENNLNSHLSSILVQLKNLQNPDGSFSWWPDMDGSFYMTVAVVKTMTRLKAMLANSQDAGSLTLGDSWGEASAWSFLDHEAARQVAEMKRLEAKKIKVMPSDALCDYVYSNALAKRKTTSDINYIVDILAKMPRDLTIYGKANSAVILAMYGRTKVASEYLQSISEYSVYKEEMGRYFDTRKALYSWFDYKIPTQTAAIEAYQLLRPADTKTITEMQRWLLQEKRTQSWDTPLNSANAIYAFLKQSSPNLSKGESMVDDSNADNSLAEREPVKLYVGQDEVKLPEGTAGTEYVKKDISNEIMTRDGSGNTIRIIKESDGTSWGAVYAQFFQPSSDIKSLSSGLTVKRELLDSKGNVILPSSEKSALAIGSKVKVRITITADRDYDFVQVIDKRASCLEPVSQLSGYNWGYYITPRDYTTNYYFDRLSKGKHTVETEYYIDRAGEYTSGTCTAQCAYSPEFMGREGGVRLSIK